MKTMSAIPGYLTVDEVADVLKVSYSQAARYVADGRLKATDLGGQYLVKEEDAKAFSRPPRGNPAFLEQKTAKKRSR